MSFSFMVSSCGRLWKRMAFCRILNWAREAIYGSICFLSSLSRFPKRNPICRLDRMNGRRSTRTRLRINYHSPTFIQGSSSSSSSYHNYARASWMNSTRTVRFSSKGKIFLLIIMGSWAQIIIWVIKSILCRSPTVLTANKTDVIQIFCS